MVLKNGLLVSLVSGTFQNNPISPVKKQRRRPTVSKKNVKRSDFGRKKRRRGYPFFGNRAVTCGFVVVLWWFFGSGGGAGVYGEDDDRELYCRGGARDTRYRGCRVVPSSRLGLRRRVRLAGGSRAGASVYLGPVAANACRISSTAVGCPKSPCPIFPPRSWNEKTRFFSFIHLPLSVFITLRWYTRTEEMWLKLCSFQRTF